MANEKQPGGSERGGSGNFANDREKAKEAGKKGGEHSHGGSQQSGAHSGGAQHGDSQSESSGESRGGSGNFAKDPEKARAAGKKGGGHSHSGS
jgi:general stress protein YciG